MEKIPLNVRTAADIINRWTVGVMGDKARYVLGAHGFAMWDDASEVYRVGFLATAPENGKMWGGLQGVGSTWCGAWADLFRKLDTAGEDVA